MALPGRGGFVVDQELFKKQLTSKEKNSDELVQQVTGNPVFLPCLIDGISSASAVTKFKCAKVLNILSEQKPGLLYPYFDCFESLLDSSNKILKWNVIDITMNLSSVDSENKVDKIFGKLFGFLLEGSLITAGHVVEGSDKLARAKPYLKERITQEILKVEQVTLPTEECRNILKGKSIDTFSRYIDHPEKHPEIVAFIRRQTRNTRNSTRKRAEDFIRKYKL